MFAIPRLHAQPLIIKQPAGQAVPLGGNAAFSIEVTGRGPFRYQWLFNGTNLPNDLITSVAGNGPAAPYNGAYSGDGGPATNASLFYPQGVRFDGDGNLYIADNNNNRVRRVDTNGIISTIAGNGLGTYRGDGGEATNASLYRPNNVTFDSAGNLYIADIFNHRVRRVDTDGIITTAAGNGVQSDTGDGGAATNAGLYYPANVDFDTAGNMYIAEVNGNRIRKVDPNGIISTVAGKGFSSFGYAGDGGAATNASFKYPQGVSLDAGGNMYIADSLNNRIRKVDTNGIITTVAGNGSSPYAGDGGAATNATLYKPWFVTVDGKGNLYIADLGHNRIRKVDADGIITTAAGNGVYGYSGDGGAATNASLASPACVALDGAGNLFIADWYNNRIREVHLAGDPVLHLADVNTSNAGTYSVVISDSSGTVTSKVARLTVEFAPIKPVVTTENDHLTINWSAVSNFTYQLQYSTNLALNEWFDLGDPIIATNDSVSVSSVIGGGAQCFYRVRLAP